ncbi:MAG: TIM44-like domain-containing protein [Deltaproteobacteria bacterium]|nr:TIM44-like domain-containing protein [Deltaproteobacteria bacterium]
MGSLLFGGFSHASSAVLEDGSSIGFLDISLIGGLLYMGYRLLIRRWQKGLQNEATDGQALVPDPTSCGSADNAADQEENETEAAPAASQDQEDQLDPEAVKGMAQDIFFKVQGAWMQQDLSSMQPLIDEYLFMVLNHDLEIMKARGQINRLENITLHQVEIQKVWQEHELEYVTIRFLANLLDYVVDTKTSQVIAGSDSEPVKFDESWTFVRPSGNCHQSWKLTKIRQA